VWVRLQLLGGQPGTRLDLALTVPVAGARGLARGSAVSVAEDDRRRSLLGPGAGFRWVAAQSDAAGTMAAVALDLPVRPGVGATAVRVQGTLLVRHGGTAATATASATLAAGAEVAAGPIRGRVLTAGRSAMADAGETLWEAECAWAAGADLLQAVTVVDAAGAEVPAAWLHATGRDIIQLTAPPTGPVRLVLTCTAG
jgi:hypothetical protein